MQVKLLEGLIQQGAKVVSLTNPTTTSDADEYNPLANLNKIVSAAI